MLFENLIKENLTNDNTQQLLIYYTNCNINYKIKILNILNILYENNLKLNIKLINLDMIQLIKLENIIESNELDNKHLQECLNIDNYLLECSQMIQLINNKLQKNTKMSDLFYNNLQHYI